MSNAPQPLVKSALVKSAPVKSTLIKSLWRGFTMKCPNCGKGRLFGRYLSVAHHCTACGEEFHHHQADDYPAYLVVAVVGHAVFPVVLGVEMAYAPPMWLYMVCGIPLLTASVLGALQPTKGAVVALQWHLGMFGFENAKRARDAEAANAQVTDAGITDTGITDTKIGTFMSGAASLPQA